MCAGPNALCAGPNHLHPAFSSEFRLLPAPDIEIQTELYLEELTDKVEENTVDTQTDPMLSRMPNGLLGCCAPGLDNILKRAQRCMLLFLYVLSPGYSISSAKRSSPTSLTSVFHVAVAPSLATVSAMLFPEVFPDRCRAHRAPPQHTQHHTKILHNVTTLPISPPCLPAGLPSMDRPPTPLFIPAKSGRDMETQIEEGDLFDFDFEVEPILEVLCPQCPHNHSLSISLSFHFVHMCMQTYAH